MKYFRHEIFAIYGNTCMINYWWWFPFPSAQLHEVTAERKRDDPLKHSRRPFGGIWNDLRKLGRRYRSDITDAFNKQVLLSILFMYIALLGPAIAFGGLMEEITLNTIGETETLLATGLGGVVYGLFAVQPISVLAFTGPVLLFETIIYRVSVNEWWMGLAWMECLWQQCKI